MRTRLSELSTTKPTLPTGPQPDGQARQARVAPEAAQLAARQVAKAVVGLACAHSAHMLLSSLLRNPVMWHASSWQMRMARSVLQGLGTRHAGTCRAHSVTSG